MRLPGSDHDIEVTVLIAGEEEVDVVDASS